ncbi:hypothetical protein MKW92_006793 [Papaver armeniacum]|nr:hypothetical protein MKW92_006793 [Papaver armeniacum]
MSSNNQLIAALATDGAITVGVALAYVAFKTWKSYYFTSNALHYKICQAPDVRISDLRQILEEEVEIGNGGSGKLVVVRGIVEIQRSVDGWRSLKSNELVSNEAGQGAGSPQSTQTVPVLLRDIGRSSKSDYLFVNMDGSRHPLPLVTVYHKLQPVQPFPCTFLQAVSGQVYPVGLLDEERVLTIGTHISAVGVCRFIDGIPQIESSHALPYFLTEMTRDQMVEDMAFKTTCLFWGGLLLGSLSVGILGYATMRNWRRWKDWMQRRKVERSRVADSAATAAAAAIATEFEADELAGEVTDKELCVICLSRRRGTLFGSCGHMVCCQICASFVQRQSSPSCPFCWQKIRSSVVIYAS